MDGKGNGLWRTEQENGRKGVMRDLLRGADLDWGLFCREQESAVITRLKL